MNTFILCLELVGTAAFAVSGAAVGIKKKMDYFGVCMLGIITAVGGGVIRDITMGQLPPVTFRHPIYAFIAFIVSTVVFLPVFREHFGKSIVFEKLLFITDSLGLGIFTVSGFRMASESGYSSNAFFVVFVAVTTGVGGGVLRDVLAGERPYIFVKHIYACASIAGAIVCLVLREFVNMWLVMSIGCAVIMAIRVMSMAYKLNLPHA